MHAMFLEYPSSDTFIDKRRPNNIKVFKSKYTKGRKLDYFYFILVFFIAKVRFPMPMAPFINIVFS